MEVGSHPRFSNQIRKSSSCGGSLGCTGARLAGLVLTAEAHNLLLWLVMKGGFLDERRSSSRACLCHNLICINFLDWDEKIYTLWFKQLKRKKYADSARNTFSVIPDVIPYQLGFTFQWQSLTSDLLAEEQQEKHFLTRPTSSSCTCCCILLSLSSWERQHNRYTIGCKFSS